MDNKWIRKRHTHARLLNASPWASCKRKRSLVKMGGEYMQHAHAWLHPFKDCLIKWVSG